MAAPSSGFEEMRAKFLMLFFLFLWFVPSLAWTFTAGLSCSLTNMTYLNKQMEMMAQREGVPVSALNLSGGIEGIWWLHGHLGLGVNFVTASGGIETREFLPVNCYALGVIASMQTSLNAIRQYVFFRIAVGGYLAAVKGLFSGLGWSLGGKADMSWVLVHWRYFEMLAALGFNYLRVKNLRWREGGEMPHEKPTLDFSGPYISLIFRWEG